MADDEIVLMSEDGKRGATFIIEAVNEKSIPQLTIIIINISFKHFFAGLTQYVLSPEQLLHGVGVSNNRKIDNLIWKEIEPAKFEISAVIKKRKIKKGGDNFSITVPFIKVYETQPEQITVELIQWYHVTENNIKIPIFSEFTRFFKIAIADKYLETRRQLLDYIYNQTNDYDELVFSQKIKTTSENFYINCTGMLSIEIPQSYQYEFGENKLPVETKIQPLALQPDYKHNNREVWLLAHDSIPGNSSEGYEVLLCQGMDYVMAKIIIIEMKYSQCLIQLFVNNQHPQHSNFINMVKDWIVSTYIDEEKSPPKIRAGGKRLDTIEKENEIKSLIEKYPNDTQEKIAMKASDKLGRNVSRQSVSRVVCQLKKGEKNS